MTPEQNDYLNQQSYLRQTQERRDARANMPGPSNMQNMQEQAMANLHNQVARANQNIGQNAADTYNAVNNMQAQMDRRSQGGPSQAYLDRYNGGRPMNNESAVPAPTPGRMMTQAVPENGGGMQDIRMSTQAVGEEGGGGMRRPDSGMDSTMAVGENGGGGISTVRDRLNPNQQRRYDRRNERYQRRDARANRRHAEDMQQAQANGASKEELMGKSLQHHMDTTKRGVEHHQKMQGFYGPKGGDGGATTAAVRENGGGGARPNPQLDRPHPSVHDDHFPGAPKSTTAAVGEKGGGGDRPTPGFAPPKAGDGNGPTPRPTPNRGNNPTPVPNAPDPRPNPTSEIAPAPQPRPNPAPTPNPEKEQRRAERTERREARTERREARQERRDNRAEKRAKREEAQKFKNGRQKRITGKDEMPYN